MISGTGAETPGARGSEAEVHPEWLGLSAQYSLFTLQCLEPRLAAPAAAAAAAAAAALQTWFCFSADGGPCAVDAAAEAV